MIEFDVETKVNRNCKTDSIINRVRDIIHW